MEDLWRENNIFYNVLCFVITENEKLFDRSDQNLYWRTVFHIFAIFHHVYVALTAVSLPIMFHDDPVVRSLYTYRTAYLTGWNFVFQTIFLGLSLGHDILEWLAKHDTTLGTKLRYWRDVIYNGMVVPYTLFVTAMFWSIYAIDRELVFPRVYDEVVPWWFNQCVHTNITVMLVIETLLHARRYPTDQKVETILHLIIAVSYAIVYYTIYYFTRRWLYQVFGIMTWWQVCLFQLLIWSSCYFFYRMHFVINRLVHRSDDVKCDKDIIEMNEDINGVNLSVNGVNDANGTAVNGTNGSARNGTNGSARNGTNGSARNSTNGSARNMATNGSARNMATNDTNDNDKVITDLKTPPFSTKSWSVKYRAVRSQFEKPS